MTVILSQCLCERGHCIIAGVFDDAQEGDEQRARSLCEQKLLRISRRCQTCGSSDLHYRNGDTICRTVAEAEPILRAPEARNRGDVDLLQYLNAEVCRLFCGKNYHGPCALLECPRRQQETLQ